MEHIKNRGVKIVEAKRELLNTLRNEKKKQLGHVLHHDCLVRTVIKGRMPEKKEKKRTKEMLLSWLVETSDHGIIDYKELAQSQ